MTYTYDSLSRLTKYRPRNGGTSRDTDYTYLDSDIPIPGLSLQATTSLVSGISQTGVSFSYGYDTQTTNIVSETRTGGAYAGTVTYEYD